MAATVFNFGFGFVALSVFTLTASANEPLADQMYRSGTHFAAAMDSGKAAQMNSALSTCLRQSGESEIFASKGYVHAFVNDADLKATDLEDTSQTKLYLFSENGGAWSCALAGESESNPKKRETKYLTKVILQDGKGEKRSFDFQALVQSGSNDSTLSALPAGAKPELGKCTKVSSSENARLLAMEMAKRSYKNSASSATMKKLDEMMDQIKSSQGPLAGEDQKKFISDMREMIGSVVDAKCRTAKASDKGCLAKKQFAGELDSDPDAFRVLERIKKFHLTQLAGSRDHMTKACAPLAEAWPAGKGDGAKASSTAN